jgi:hypothetical protein
MMHQPGPTEYAPFYADYVALVPEEEIVPALEAQLEDMLSLLRGVPEEQASVRHAPYTWSIKQVVGHVTDAERIFAGRALRFARSDPSPLPGFDENAYARVAGFDRLPLGDVVSELEAVRRANLWLFRHLPDAAWSRSGEANGNVVSVRALAYIIAGHARHHTAILRRRLAGARTVPG